MYRDDSYKKLITSHRWAKVRRAKAIKCPLCERCLEKGRTSLTQEVHHILPIQNAMNFSEMEKLCFLWSNLQSLCSGCHVEVHREMTSYTKEYKIERAKAKTNDFVNKFMKDSKSIG